MRLSVVNGRKVGGSVDKHADPSRMAPSCWLRLGSLMDQNATPLKWIVWVRIPFEARGLWLNGRATDCGSVGAGSIPASPTTDENVNRC